jgi:hypothetical protein
VPLRSRYVNEPNQIGVWGGKADEEEGENELGIVNVVKREFREETGYNGEIELIPAYIYQTPSKSFTYYNFIGLVEDEFTPLLDWETKNAKWITLEELVKYEDFIIIDFGYGINKYYKHFGLMSLLNDKNSMDLLTSIRFAKGGKVKDGGDCYLVAGQLALEIKNKKIDYKGTPYLVHAEVKHSAIEGVRFGHAFIEDDENVYDFSNNREIILPKQLYYYFGDINPRDKKKYRKYTFEEAREKMLSTGNYGCWDIEVDFEKGGRVFNDKEMLAKFKKGESIGFTGVAHLKSKGLIPRADGVKRISEKYMENGGRTISQTPSPKKDQIVGSDVNKKSSSENLSSAKLIKFDAKTLNTIKNKVAKHNEENPNKKINLASAKAVVRRGMGAYSQSHRPTITNGLPNSRLAWGLARLNAFTYKIINGKSKSGKYKQDDDLIEELGFKVANYKNGGEMKKDIRCINCGWEWNKKDSELWDMYVCHKCGFDNTTFYTSIPVNNYSKGGETKTKSPNYLKMFLGK